MKTTFLCWHCVFLPGLFNDASSSRCLGCPISQQTSFWDTFPGWDCWEIAQHCCASSSRGAHSLWVWLVIALSLPAWRKGDVLQTEFLRTMSWARAQTLLPGMSHLHDETGHCGTVWLNCKHFCHMYYKYFLIVALWHIESQRGKIISSIHASLHMTFF